MDSSGRSRRIACRSSRARRRGVSRPARAPVRGAHRRLRARRRSPHVSARARVRPRARARAVRCAGQRGADAASGGGAGIQRRLARCVGAGGDRARRSARADRRRAMLRRYSRSRRIDRTAGIAFTHGLVRAVRQRPSARSLAARVGAHFARRRSGGEARVHARDAVRRSLAVAKASPPFARAHALRRERSKKRATLREIERRKSRARIAHRDPGNGYNPLPPRQFSASDFRFIHRAHRSITPSATISSSRRWPGVTDRPFRQLCKRLGAGYAVSEMVASNPRLRGTEKSLRRTDHRGEVGTDRRPDRRRGSRRDGRRRALQRRARRADHRHQHGLSGEEGVQCRRRLRAARERAAGRGDRRRPWCARSTCRSRSRSARAAIPCTGTRSRSRGSPRPPASGRSPFTAARAPARSSVRSNTTRSAPSRRRWAIPVIANGDVSTPEQAALVLRLHRRGCDHDRPRRAGPALDLPRDPPLPRHGARTCRRRRWPRPARRSSRTSTITTRSTAKARACASRASISVGTRRSSPAAKRSGARSTRLETSAAQLAAVGRFFDTLAERGERLDYRAPVAAIGSAHPANRRSRQESQRGGEALAA